MEESAELTRIKGLAAMAQRTVRPAKANVRTGEALPLEKGKRWIVSESRKKQRMQ